MAESTYRVIIEKYAERHYIKKFEKKYKTRWEGTLRAIVRLCEYIDITLKTQQADLIKYSASRESKLVKLDFAIFGDRKSAKAAGNRCILFADEGKREVRVLLVYSKNEIGAPGETEKWRRIVREAYPGMWARLMP